MQVTENTTSIASSILNYYKDIFTLRANTLSYSIDPFLGTTNQYELWRSADFNSWLWLNSTTKEVVFLQDYDTLTKKHYALYF